MPKDANINLRGESPAVSIRRCQDANTITMCTVCKSHLQSNFYLASNVLKYFVAIIFSLRYDSRLDMSELVTYWIGVTFCEPDETINSMIKMKQSHNNPKIERK